MERIMKTSLLSLIAIVGFSLVSCADLSLKTELEKEVEEFNSSSTIAPPPTTTTISDSESPTGSVSVQDDISHTNTAIITLEISGTDNSGTSGLMVAVRNDTNWTLSDFVPYVTTRQWTLPGGNGQKTVFAWFKDASGNISVQYSFDIILDNVGPQGTTNPANNAVNVTRNNSIVINFNEAVDQSTLVNQTSSANSSVYIMQGSNFVSCSLVKTSTSATLTPSQDLKYGFQYSVTFGTGIKDLAGNGITNANTHTFTVEDDFYENPNGNQNSANAFDLSDAGMGPENLVDAQFQSTVAGGVAILKNLDFYKLNIDDPFTLRVRVYFSTPNGTIAAAGPDDIRLSVTRSGFGLGAVQTIITNLANDREYEFDISSRGAGDYIILVYEQNNNYANRRTYNIEWYAEPGI